MSTTAFTQSTLGWRDDALCRLFPFLPWTTRPDNGDRARMLEVCRSCTVKSECADDVVQIDWPAEVFGVWAGMVGEELQEYIAERRSAVAMHDFDDLEPGWDPDDLEWS